MTVKTIYILPNGTVTVFDENGEQITELQGGWINFDYLKKLAQVIVKDEPVVNGELPALAGYVEHYRRYSVDSHEAKDCKDCPQCKHPECRHKNGPCNYGGDCGCDRHIKCTCGHSVGAHFDGNFEYQACLHEDCECLKFYMTNKEEK